ncbi:MAG: ABC transporter ATP-binding protein [Clostridia bacterium]|nr:ABC transporter ATP-binding protein [Clostridia bacterium]
MIIETHDLTRVYGEGDNKIRALDMVNLSVERGEFLSVVGTSGSGKSTLLHLLGGLDRPTDGRVFIDGTDLYSLKPDALTVFRRRFIGFVFQSYNLIPGLNVWENITLPLGLDGIRADKDEIENLLASLGIADKRFAMPSELSGGQQQRVAIARALAAKPHIVLADEPTGNLDSRTSLEVLLLLGQLNRELSQTIVMITHNEELAQMTTRRVHMEDGRIVSDSGKAVEA